MTTAFRVLVALLFAFLLAPVLLVVPMSFSADAYLGWPPSGWSLRWYEALPHQAALGAAFRTSLLLATVVTALSLLIGLAAALALARGRFPGREALSALLTAPLLLPTIVLGLAVLMVFVRSGLIGSWAGLVLAHLLVALPYALRLLVTALSALPPAIEDAAASLGAPPLQVLLRVTLPMMSSGLAAAGAIVFLLSFDEVVVSLFVVGPRLTTLPVALYHYIESHSDPLVAAVSALMIAGTLGLVIVLDRTVGLRRAVGGG
jgi:putative spermidine/putrescine transport system permease protein